MYVLEKIDTLDHSLGTVHSQLQISLHLLAGGY